MNLIPCLPNDRSDIIGTMFLFSIDDCRTKLKLAGMYLNVNGETKLVTDVWRSKNDLSILVLTGPDGDIEFVFKTIGKRFLMEGEYKNFRTKMLVCDVSTYSKSAIKSIVDTASVPVGDGTTVKFVKPKDDISAEVMFGENVGKGTPSDKNITAILFGTMNLQREIIVVSEYDDEKKKNVVKQVPSFALYTRGTSRIMYPNESTYGPFDPVFPMKIIDKQIQIPMVVVPLFRIAARSCSDYFR